MLPLLAEKVTTFKGMTPVVVALRNEALKPHHWEQIEAAIHSDIERGDNFTLGYLLELKVNEYREEIETVSTAATQENVLEEMLAKVENAWKPLEFIVNTYKESKDVFILGGVDDVMAVLEETQVLVQTILGSRFVGPMQKRVDEWEKSCDSSRRRSTSGSRCSGRGCTSSRYSRRPTFGGSCPTSTRTSTRSTRCGLI